MTSEREQAVPRASVDDRLPYTPEEVAFMQKFPPRIIRVIERVTAYTNGYMIGRKGLSPEELFQVGKCWGEEELAAWEQGYRDGVRDGYRERA